MCFLICYILYTYYIIYIPDKGVYAYVCPLCKFLWSDVSPFLLRTGFIRGVQYTLRLVEDALLHGGPPCGTYVWVNRATRKRSGECPDGDFGVASVANANLLLDPMVMLYDIGLFSHKT